jgi:hypothetical protein
MTRHTPYLFYGTSLLLNKMLIKKFFLNIDRNKYSIFTFFIKSQTLFLNCIFESLNLFSMPTLSISKFLLDKHLGVKYSKDEVDELCFNYGLELDDVVRLLYYSDFTRLVLRFRRKTKMASSTRFTKLTFLRIDTICSVLRVWFGLG